MSHRGDPAGAAGTCRGRSPAAQGLFVHLVQRLYRGVILPAEINRREEADRVSAAALRGGRC
jgi:hypothetical protein